MHASLQRKFSFSYIAIILAVLILLNTYPLITSENLTFRSKQSSLQGSVSVMVTALSGLEELSEENVAGAMTLVEETGISRVLVTDASGRVLYDTRETDGAIGRYAFYTELVQALRGEDVFYTEFSDKAFKSRAASPVIYHSQTIGAVYAYEYDTQQAELPEGCTVFDNPVGTAPGCAFEAEGVHVLMLPGPPFEMRTMLQNWAVPYLRGLSKEVIVSHDIMTFGLGESPMEDLMRERISRMENPSLATYAKPSEVRLRATAKADSAAAAEAMLVPVVKEVTDYLGDVVYGVDIPNLETVCMTHLKEKGWTFATAESCTGGLLGDLLTNVPGASAVFAGGIIAYNDETKTRLLDVDPALIARCGAVSPEVAAAMAEHVRAAFGTDLGLSITGLAGPDGDGVHTVGTLFVALATPDGTFHRTLHKDKWGRVRIKHAAANHAFDMLRRYLTGLPVEMEENR